MNHGSGVCEIIAAVRRIEDVILSNDCFDAYQSLQSWKYNPLAEDD